MPPNADASAAPGGSRRSTVVISGASSGVGRALARCFALTASRVVLLGRDADRLAAAAADVERQGAGAEYHGVELGSAEALEALAATLAERLPQVSALLHCAGEFASSAVADAPPGELERLFAVNLRAPYVLTRALLGALEAGAGDVVFINSSAVGQRRPGLSAYGASKAGLVALADSLRQEVNPLGVRVLSVFLGATATPMQEHIYARAAREYHPEALLQPDDVASIVHAALRLPRGAEVTDIHLRPATAHRP